MSSVARFRAGVLGSPIAHSLSPVLHTAAYRALGLPDWEYRATEVSEGGFVDHVRGLDPTWRGLSFTMPLKELAFEVAQDVSPVAAATGVINTLLRRQDGGWDGDNPDVAGIVLGLAEAGIDGVTAAVVVGSGATARSVVAALASLGARRVDFMVRDEIRPATARHATAAGLEVGRRGLGDWPADVEVVVSTVPSGLEGVAATLPPGGRVVLDVVYGEGPSVLAAAAERRGYLVVPGTVMLLHQAAVQVRLMTGYAAPVAAMRAALAESLALRAATSSA